MHALTIGVDGNEANVEKAVGVSVYTQRLLAYFHSHASEETRFRIFLRRRPLPMLPPETEFFRYQVVPGPVAWSQIFFPLHLSFNRSVDVLFCPAHYAPRRCPVPFVVTIHDLSYFYYPDEFLKKDLYKLKNWTAYSLDQADHVLSVSKTTKKDILQWYELDTHKVSVVYNGFEKETKKNIPSSLPTESPLAQLKKKKYVLYVGTLQPRKNVSFLIQAFARFYQDNPSYRLVIAGKKGWLYQEILNEAAKHGIADVVLFPGFVSDEELIWLYRHAFCFVQPSLYEGFGIPILEAMAYDCPVIASQVSSLPEVGGEACLYMDPNDVSDLHAKLRLLIENKVVRSDLIKKGKKQIQQFSWDTCGAETLEVLGRVVVGS